MPETCTASAITFSTSTAVTVALNPASGTEFAGQVFNPLHAVWIDDPLVLSGEPVTGSVVCWTASTPGASSCTVETSINNGASWDLAVSGAPVPRLANGNTTTRQVLTRVTFTRASAGDASPRLLMLDVQVAGDASVDELVAVGHGVIVKTTPKIGQGEGRSSGPGVFSSGGGMTGTGLHLKIKCVDPSRYIAKNPWTQAKTFPSQPYEQAAVAMVRDRLPDQDEFSVTTVNRVCEPLIYGLNQATDAWQDLRDLATACGFQAFFDNAGVFVFRPVTDPRTARPVWTFDDGERCTVTQAERELSDDQTLNWITVKGEATSSQNPVSATEYDDDPASPTYAFGRFGVHAATVIITSVTTEDQARQAAKAILYASIGAAETTTITTVPIPFLECGDCVTVDIGDIKADGRYVISQITLPLSPAGAMTLTCFRQSSTE